MIEEQFCSHSPPVSNARVIEAMGRVPRHEFVPAESRNEAYGDYPIHIGYSQTISQPYIVALMTELLDPKPDERILEIGTGSAYQAAVLAEMAGEVKAKFEGVVNDLEARKVRAPEGRPRGALVRGEPHGARRRREGEVVHIVHERHVIVEHEDLVKLRQRERADLAKGEPVVRRGVPTRSASSNASWSAPSPSSGFGKATVGNVGSGSHCLLTG